MRKRAVFKGLVVAALAAGIPWAMAAAPFPSKPVTIVVPFPAGGALDNVARALAESMRKSLGQPVIVDNRGGAGGTLGSSLVARAAPDGYTILLGSVATHAIASGLYPHLPYDPLADFSPITQLTSSPLILTASEKLNVASVKDLIALAKSRPGTLNYASTGNGTALHVAGELFRTAAGIQVLHVPYKGGGEAMNAMLSGEVSYILANPQLVMSFIRAGRMRGLAVTGNARLEALPELPTLAEAGLAGVDVTTWFGLWAPKGTPVEAIDRLNAEARKALASPEIKRQLASQGDSPVGSSVAEFTAFTRAEHQRWVQLVRSAGIKLE